MQTFICARHFEVVQQFDQFGCYISTSGCKPFQSFLIDVVVSRGCSRRCKPALKFVQRGCKLCELKVLSRRAISALVDIVGSNYDLAAEVYKLKDRSREAQGAYRVHRGGRSTLVVSGSIPQEK